MIPQNFKDAVYVVVQLIIFLIYVFWEQPLFSFELPVWGSYICWLVLVFAAGLFLLAAWNIRHALSPYPSPKAHARLQTSGAFAFSRHPIYSSLIIGLLAWGILQENGNQLIISVILLLFFYVKASYEEKLLTDMFTEYPDYQKQRGMLFPKLNTSKS